MQQYKYLYTKRTAAKIRSFYKNVAKKYRHTYSYEDMERNVRDAFFAIYYIERTLPRRKPTLRLCFSNTTGTTFIFRLRQQPLSTESVSDSRRSKIQP